MKIKIKELFGLFLVAVILETMFIAYEIPHKRVQDTSESYTNNIYVQNSIAQKKYFS